MLFGGLFILELFALYILSQNVTVFFSRFFFGITRSKRLTVYLLAFLFLPGTFLHELSHWLTAKLLLVGTGSMSLKPVPKDDGVRLGSVEVAKTDPIRRLLIGTAPVVWGLSIIIVCLYSALLLDIYNTQWETILLGYAVFEIGNTMFSSKKDMEGALGLFLIVILVGVVSYLLGVRINFSSLDHILFQPSIVNLLRKGCFYLLFPIGVDGFFVLLFTFFNR